MSGKISEKEHLKVIEATPRDAGRGIVRIDTEYMERNGLEPGDVVIVEGTRKTAAIVWPSYPDDEGTGTIRMDGITRKNAGAGIDDKVVVRKADVKKASRVVFSPTEPIKIFGAEYLSQILEGRVLMKGDAVELNLMGRKVTLIVTSYAPSADVVMINGNTEVEVSEKIAKEKEVGVSRVSYEDIGGLKEEIKKVREMIELPLRHPELFDRLGIEAPKGVLLHGPPGTGKTLLAKAVANETNANFYSISGPEIMSKFYGQSEENLREIFKEAEENAPSIIFIDEIDSIAPKRDDIKGEVETRVVAQLLALMDGLKSRGRVVVIGATNRPNALDPALRRPGRFDREIELGIPNRDARHEILQIHTRGMPLAEDVDLAALADLTHGYSGADLAALVKEAGMKALRRILPNIDMESEKIPVQTLNSIKVTKDDFIGAFREMEPSTLREVLIERPNVHWGDIGGLEAQKEELKEAVEWPLKYPALFRHFNTKPPKGILLYGPPGTGKTLLAKAVATESEANFISVKGPEFLSKWVGESEKAVRETFRKAKMAAPCVIFFDEIDAIVPVRGQSCDSHVTERVISQMLSELDGIEELHNVVVIAATNRPDIIDPAVLRPGRFDRLIYVPMPGNEERLSILKIHTKNMPLAEDVKIERIVELTENYNGADLAAVVQKASYLAMREYLNESGGKVDEEKLKNVKVTMKHFEEALKQVKPLSKQEIERYTRMCESFRKRE
ncbi:MAG: CDC48 family AAA ATPase [Thermoplasmata archaeon]|nr:CDC48 family AAA ATPase [Thermoplasmata archaeon]